MHLELTQISQPDLHMTGESMKYMKKINIKRQNFLNSTKNLKIELKVELLNSKVFTKNLESTFVLRSTSWWSFLAYIILNLLKFGKFELGGF